MKDRVNQVDIVVIGAGFAGSLMAAICRTLGKSVLVIERDKHPRFAIGESTTPLTNLLLEEIGREFSIDFLSELSTWGAWQERHADIPVGLKRGFSFFHHDEKQPFRRYPDHRNELLVAASPSDRLGDTHWFRESFDSFMLQKALGSGIDYLDETSLSSVQESKRGLLLSGSRKGLSIEVEAKFVIDASGPRGALFHLLQHSERTLKEMPATRSVFGHFKGVKRCADSEAFALEGSAPYPIDDAAVHHVFEEGWFWMLRFNNGVTSAGVVANSRWGAWDNDASALENWRAALERFPSLEDLFCGASVVGEMKALDRVPFCTSEVSSSRYALLPSAIASIDPLYSTGFPLALLGMARLGIAIRDSWGTESFSQQMAEYERVSVAEVDRVARLVGLSYRVMGRPALFNAVSSIYFACVSFQETKRRLGHSSLESSFLLGDEPSLSSRIDKCLNQLETLASISSLSGEQQFEWVQKALTCIEPFNVIGIGDESRGNWYPVDMKDLFDCCGKLPASPGEITGMLQRLGLAP